MRWSRNLGFSAHDNRRFAPIAVFDSRMGQVQCEDDRLVPTGPLFGQYAVQPLPRVAKRAKRILDARAPVRAGVDLPQAVATEMAERTFEHEWHAFVAALSHLVTDAGR